MQDGRVGIEFLLSLLDRAFHKHSWHGPNLKGSIRRVTAGEAAWRPGPGRKSIWEITLHAAYWKYAVRRRLLGEKRGSFALKGSNWFPMPAARGEKESPGQSFLKITKPEIRTLCEISDNLDLNHVGRSTAADLVMRINHRSE